MKPSNFPRKAIAALGHRVGAAKKHGHGYVYLPLELADELKKYLSTQSRIQYIKEYRKL